MNYITIRILMLFIIFVMLIYIIINRKLYKFIFSKIKNSYLSKLILIFIFIIVYKIVWIFPFEGTILKFNEADNIISYFIKSEKIIKKYIFDEYAYVLFKNDSEFPDFIYFIKDEKDNWKLGNTLHDGRGENILYNDCFISKIEVPTKNSMGIMIYNPVVEDDENYKVYDSLNTKIDTLLFDQNEKYNEMISIVIINSDVPDNYTIYINDKEFKLFEKQ